MTFNNDLERDLETLVRFHEFREEAERKGFRYFLEVFDPNVPGAVAPEILPHYLNDMITRMLAGVGPAGRPAFLKIVYHGPKAMEELVRFDPHLVVGILGGSAGTTRDAFQLLHDAQKYGAKVALFGRKINHAENQLAFVHFLRLIVEGQIAPLEAVKAYHAVLGRLGLRPHRSLEDDLKVTDQSMSYAGTTVSPGAAVGTSRQPAAVDATASLSRSPRRSPRLRRGEDLLRAPASPTRAGTRARPDSCACPDKERRPLVTESYAVSRYQLGSYEWPAAAQRPSRFRPDDSRRAPGLSSRTARAGALTLGIAPGYPYSPAST